MTRDEADDSALQAAVQMELARPRRLRMAFPALVEQRFEQDEGPQRRRALVLAGTIGLLIYASFLLNDLHIRQEIFRQAVLWRSVALVFGAGVLTAIHRQWVGAAWRERLLSMAIVVVMGCSCVILDETQSQARLYDPFAFSLIFLAGNISLPLRFRAAVGTSVACLALAALYIAPDDRLPVQARIFAMALMSGTAVFTVQACYSIERSSRLSYLLRLRETLASRAAERRADGFARLSQTDALTGLPNRRAFELAIDSRWRSGAASARWLALVLIDIDNFKPYNDTFGHPAGDACLTRVARAMHDVLPHDGFLARIGGEEFVAVLEGASAAQCQAAAERLRRAVEALGLPNPQAGGAGLVTISLGVALRPPGGGGEMHAMVASADAALYRAKHGGRNRLAHASQPGALDATARAG